KQIADQQVLYDKMSVQLVELDKHVRDLKNTVNKTAKDLWDALVRHMLGSEYGEQDRKAVVLYEYETFNATEGELLLDTYIRYLQVINDLKKCGWNDAIGSKKKTVVVTSDLLALIAEKTNMSRSKEKVVVSSDSEGKINANMVFMAQIEKVLSDSEASSSSADKKISETVHMIMPSKDNLYNGRKGIGFENPRYFEKAKDLRPTLYDEKQTSSLKPYVPNVILEKIIIDLEDEVVNLLEKEKVNLDTIESLKSKGVESSENVSSKLENQSENYCLVVENECDKEENPKVIASGMFKLNVSQCVSPISISKSSCDSNNVEIK
nr:hypothetical protein [Tanacetum cinerariifolium]